MYVLLYVLPWVRKCCIPLAYTLPYYCIYLMFHYQAIGFLKIPSSTTIQNENMVKWLLIKTIVDIELITTDIVHSRGLSVSKPLMVPHLG